MRKLLIAALITVTLGTSAFAKETKGINTNASRNFRTEFTDASQVSWTTSEHYLKATFIQNDQRMEAYYDASGEKIGTSRAISIEELPLKTKRKFAKDFSNYTVKESIEFEGTEETSYFISAENEKESVILKVDGAGALSRYKVTKK